MNNYDIKKEKDGFSLIVNGKAVMSGTDKVSILLEVIADMMDEESIRELSKKSVPLPMHHHREELNR